jgi:prevent-host-death family protein
MVTVSVSELKANLSRFLREVRRGGEVQILDRGRPIARITGLRGGTDDDRRERLIRAGTLRPGTADATAVLEEPLLELPADLTGALADERDDRV